MADAMTADDWSRLNDLRAQFAPHLYVPPDDGGPSPLSRIGMGISNLPYTVSQNVGRSLLGVLGSMTGATDEQKSAIQSEVDPSISHFNIPPPKTIGQSAADIVPGLLGTVATAALPGGVAADAASLLGAGRFAPIIGDVVAGGFVGAGQNQTTSTGAEFGSQGLLMRAPIPGYLKALGMAAIPLAGEAIRGGDPFNQGSLINAGASAIVPALLGHYSDSQQRPQPLLQPASAVQEPPQPLLSPGAPDYTQSILASRADEARNALYPNLNPAEQDEYHSLSQILPDQISDAQYSRVKELESKMDPGSADFVGQVPDNIDPSIAAYHGTPHDVDQFDTNKIGTGEGNQNYGHGLYFSGNEDVAKAYQDEFKAANPNANLYAVNLDVENEDLLDHDKPLSQQPQKVQDAFAPYLNESWLQKYFGADPNGSDLFTIAKNIASVEKTDRNGTVRTADLPGLASDWLNDRGVPGIRYLDEYSRDASDDVSRQQKWVDALQGQGGSTPTPNNLLALESAKAALAGAQNRFENPTHNYVVFDPDKIQITHKNGEAIGSQEALSGVSSNTPDPSMVEEPPTQTQQPADIAKSMQDVAAQYPGVDFRVHGSPSDAPELQGKIKPSTQYEGLSDPSGENRFGGKGVQYGFTDNISTPDRGREVAVHEIVGHHGFDKVVKPEDWAGIEQHVMERGGRMRDDIAAEYRDKATGEAASSRRIAREYVARVAENTNLDPTLWQKVTAAVRSGLRAVGIRRDWSDAEIQDLIRSAHKNLKEGATPNDLIRSSVDAARLRTATPQEQQEYRGLASQHAASPDLLTSTQKARMADLARRMPAEGASPSGVEQPVRDAYNRLTARSGLPNVAISDLARESGQPLPEVKSLLGRASQQGKAALSLGDWSLSDEAKRAGAIDTPAQKGNLLVRLNGEQIDPSLPRPMLEAAKDQEEGKQSLLGYVSRGLQRNFGMSNTPELSRAREKATGLASLLGKNASEPLRGLFKEAPLTPAEVEAGRKYNNSSGGPDAEREMRATVNPKAADYLVKAKTGVQPEASKTIASAETPEHAATINKSDNRYQRRAYEIDTNGQQFLRKMARGEKDLNIKDAVSYFKANPYFAGASDATIERTIRQVLTDRARGLGFTGEGGNKISQSLYITKKDLTPPQWDMMQALRSDPRISAHDQGLIQDAVRDGHLTPATQERMGAIAEGGALSKDESAMLSDIAAKETVDPRIRALFGEHTNPIEQAAYSMQKLVGSVKQAETINQIADAETPDGRKLSYATPKDYEDALKASSGDTKAALLRYKPLPSSDGYGKLSGRLSDIGVHDALDALNRGMDAGGNAILGKIQKVMKLNATVLNASTHAHWWMQIPLMMSMGRVYNPADWLDAAKIVLGKNAAHDAIREELTRNGVLETGAAMDAGATARQFSALDQPTSVFGKIKTGSDKAVKFLGDLYSHPDEIIRTAVYLKAKARALAAGMVDKDAQNQAIDFTNKYTFNYKALPRGIAAMSNTPGINPFMGYSTELARITKNLAQDVISGTSEDRLHAALNLGLMAAVPLAASMGSSATNLNANDQKDWARMRKLEDIDKQSQIKFVLGRDQKTGAFHYIDIAPLVPAGDTFTLAKDILSGKWKNAMLDQPVVGLSHSPIASLGIDLATGQNQGTGQKLFTAGDYAQRVSQSLLPPLLGTQGQRLVRGFTTNNEGGLGLTNPRTGRVDTPMTSLLGTAGIRIQGEQMANLIQAAQSDAQEEKDANRQQLMQTMRTNAGPAAQQAALFKFQSRNQDIQRELLKRVSP